MGTEGTGVSQGLLGAPGAPPGFHRPILWGPRDEGPLGALDYFHPSCHSSYPFFFPSAPNIKVVGRIWLLIRGGEKAELHFCFFFCSSQTRKVRSPLSQRPLVAEGRAGLLVKLQAWQRHFKWDYVPLRALTDQGWAWHFVYLTSVEPDLSFVVRGYSSLPSKGRAGLRQAGSCFPLTQAEFLYLKRVSLVNDHN